MRWNLINPDVVINITHDYSRCLCRVCPVSCLCVTFDSGDLTSMLLDHFALSPFLCLRLIVVVSAQEGSFRVSLSPPLSPAAALFFFNFYFSFVNCKVAEELALKMPLPLLCAHVLLLESNLYRMLQHLPQSVHQREEIRLRETEIFWLQPLLHRCIS